MLRWLAEWWRCCILAASTAAASSLLRRWSMAETVFHLIKVAPTVIILELTERVMPDYFGLGLGTIVTGSLACDPPPLSLLSLFLVMAVCL